MASFHARSLTFSCLVALLAAGEAGAVTVPEHPWCGAGATNVFEKAAIHRDHERRLAGRRAVTAALAAQPQAARAGAVAVLVDHGDLVVQPNRVDLSGFGVQFVPQKKGAMLAAPSGDPVVPEIGERLVLGDDDARLVSFPKGFRFLFYGRAHTRMYVHSDGNLTFEAPEASSAPRSLARLLGGPPRIGALFADLNPETATGAGGVYVLLSKAKVVVTWLELPEFGRPNRNTVQAVLYPNGRVTFAYGALAAQEAIVGVAPGRGGDVRLLDLTAALPTGPLKTAIAERFAASRELDDLGIARAFFREFADVYDHLIVFLDFPQSLGGAFAFEVTVKNEIRGIGIPLFDASAQAGSRGRLRSYVQMGSLARYPADPAATFLGTNSTLDVLGQETGHRWLAFLGFRDENGQPSAALLGRDLAHWSFCHDSLASDMEGNQFRDDGGGAYTTVAATDRFSPLDQYAMGLIPAAAVPPFYYIDGCFDRAAAPQLGVPVTGRRVDVAIDQIVALHGPRFPVAAKSPHRFNMAFVLVSQGGVFPSPESIAKVDRIRAGWEGYFADATDGRGAVSTALVLKKRR